MLVVRLAFQDADSLIDGDTTLDDGRVSRRRHHATALDVLVHAGGEVVSSDLDLGRKLALAQQLGRGLRRG